MYGPGLVDALSRYYHGFKGWACDDGLGLGVQVGLGLGLGLGLGFLFAATILTVAYTASQSTHYIGT